jgi:hypothetical protein
MTAWLVMENGRHTEATRELDSEGNCTRLTVVATDLNAGVSLTSRHSYQYREGNLASSVTDIGTDAERHHTFRILRRPGKQIRRLPGIRGYPRRPRPLARAVTCSKRPSPSARKTPKSIPTPGSTPTNTTRRAFPTRIITERAYAATTTSSEAVYEYDCN